MRAASRGLGTQLASRDQPLDKIVVVRRQDKLLSGALAQERRRPRKEAVERAWRIIGVEDGWR
jgi:hypothetical protein